MKRKSAHPNLHPNFNQRLELLRAHGFDVAPYAGVAGGSLVSKYGAGAVLVAVPEGKDEDDAAAAYAIHPGAVVKGEVARLLDRGYQKFIKTSQYELPASATQLQAIHEFSEELKQLIGAISLYNESLGTTSDVYLYDRLVGREDAGREAEPHGGLAQPPGVERQALIPAASSSGAGDSGADRRDPADAQGAKRVEYLRPAKRSM
jgi:hypothetical protein